MVEGVERGRQSAGAKSEAVWINVPAIRSRCVRAHLSRARGEPNAALLYIDFIQHLAEKLAHYLSETGNAYSEDPPGEIMKHRMQQAQERGHVGQHHCKAL